MTTSARTNLPLRATEPQISYETQTPIPSQGPLLRHEGPEGDDTFTGYQITRLDSALGNLVTVVLRLNADTGGISITVLVPKHAVSRRVAR